MDHNILNVRLALDLSTYSTLVVPQAKKAGHLLQWT